MSPRRLEDLFGELLDEVHVAELLSTRADPVRAIFALGRVQDLAGALIERVRGAAVVRVGGRRAAAVLAEGAATSAGPSPAPRRAAPSSRRGTVRP